MFSLDFTFDAELGTRDRAAAITGHGQGFDLHRNLAYREQCMVVA